MAAKNRYCFHVVSGILLSCAMASAVAQSDKVSDGVVKIGVLTDMAGSTSDITGEGSVIAVRMAVEDFGGNVLGKPIEVIVADHQQKADVAANIARKWIDVEKVDVIVELPNSNTALAVAGVAKAKNRIVIVSGAASDRLTNEECTPVTVHYTYDTYSLANSTALAIVKEGGDSWFFLTADYTFGTTLEQETTNVVTANGGKVLGSVRHPINASDFSSAILQAQQSGAKVIGLANAGGDTINSIKTAKEFKITDSGKQRLAGLLLYITDINALGLETAQGLLLTDAFYWDYSDETRKWSRRFFERRKKMPTSIQAGDYSSTMHYLKAIQAAGTDETGAVMAKMKSMPINDFFAKNGKIRDDGRMVHDMYLLQVKKPSESKYPWDYFTVKSVIPGEQAFRPLSKSVCSLVKK
jgi:branched-chain amino acid transport system substrate-binding protein